MEAVEPNRVAELKEGFPNATFRVRGPQTRDSIANVWGERTPSA